MGTVSLGIGDLHVSLGIGDLYVSLGIGDLHVSLGIGDLQCYTVIPWPHVWLLHFSFSIIGP